MRSWNIWSCFFMNVHQHVCSFRCKLSSLFTFVFLKCLFVFWASRIFRVQNRFCHAELLKNNRLGQYGKEKLLNWCKPSNLFTLRLILIFNPSKMLWKSNVLFYFAWTPPWTLDFMKKKIKSLALFNAINTLSGHSKDISCFVVCVDKVALPLLINLAVL